MASTVIRESATVAHDAVHGTTVSPVMGGGEAKPAR